MFFDLNKAYDSVQRSLLWSSLVDELGLPPSLIERVKLLYVGLRARSVEDKQDCFGDIPISIGVK